VKQSVRRNVCTFTNDSIDIILGANDCDFGTKEYVHTLPATVSAEVGKQKPSVASGALAETSPRSLGSGPAPSFERGERWADSKARYAAWQPQNKARAHFLKHNLKK
jgi:hypothetical protein